MSMFKIYYIIYLFINWIAKRAYKLILKPIVAILKNEKLGHVVKKYCNSNVVGGLLFEIVSIKNMTNEERDQKLDFDIMSMLIASLEEEEYALKRHVFIKKRLEDCVVFEKDGEDWEYYYEIIGYLLDVFENYGVFVNENDQLLRDTIVEWVLDIREADAAKAKALKKAENEIIQIDSDTDDIVISSLSNISEANDGSILSEETFYGDVITDEDLDFFFDDMIEYFMCQFYLYEPYIFINSTQDSLIIHEYFTILIYLLFAILLSYVILGFSYIFVIQNPETEKMSAYECGFEPYEDARQKFDVKFYIVAMLFIIFDIETMYLIPWCVALPYINSVGYFVMMEFILELCVGFLYVWYIGGLEWD